jgi:hypothetical protein
MTAMRIEGQQNLESTQTTDRAQQSNASAEAWDTMRQSSTIESKPFTSPNNQTKELVFDDPFPKNDVSHFGPDPTDNNKPEHDGHGEKPEETDKAARSALWGDHKDDPLAAITPEAVHQGNLGDCYFLAPVASLAATNPQAIKDMIRDNGNNTYTVTFPGDPTHPVTVDAPTDAELAKYAHNDQANGDWVNVLEKAHRKYTGRETEDPGDNPQKAITLLTGKNTIDDDLTGGFARIGRTTEENVAKDIKNAMKDGRVITADTSDGNFLRDYLGADNNPGELVHNHAFAITGFDEKTNMITMRNPWGNDGKEGTFQISLDDFYNKFSDMQIAQS